MLMMKMDSKMTQSIHAIENTQYRSEKRHYKDVHEAWLVKFHLRSGGRQDWPWIELVGL
jgi:hypothetical protein